MWTHRDGHIDEYTCVCMHRIPYMGKAGPSSYLGQPKCTLEVRKLATEGGLPGATHVAEAVGAADSVVKP